MERSERALRLQGLWVMKRMLVAFLAVVSLGLYGCGVGVDDPEAAAALGLDTKAQAATGDEAAISGEKLGAYDPRIALPQDPIPVQPLERPTNPLIQPPPEVDPRAPVK